MLLVRVAEGGAESGQKSCWDRSVEWRCGSDGVDVAGTEVVDRGIFLAQLGSLTLVSVGVWRARSLRRCGGGLAGWAVKSSCYPFSLSAIT